MHENKNYKNKKFQISSLKPTSLNCRAQSNAKLLSSKLGIPNNNPFENNRSVFDYPAHPTKQFPPEIAQNTAIIRNGAFPPKKAPSNANCTGVLISEMRNIPERAQPYSLAKTGVKVPRPWLYTCAVALSRG